MTEEKLLDTLKAILLEDDREINQQVQDEIAHLKEEILNPDKFGEKTGPHIDHKIEYLQTHFSELFGDEVTDAIKVQIRDSKDEVIEALYPIMGKLIQRFIQAEIERLSERIDSQINSTFSWEGWKRRAQSWFTGTKQSDIILSELNNAEVEEIFVINKESGLLLGSYSINDTVDQDMIAGMLTAIKSFVEDAFHKGSEDLETIAYGNYKILIHNFHSFYISVSVSGTVNSSYKMELKEKLLTFASKYLTEPIHEVNSDVVTEISGHLSEFFKPNP